MVTVTVGCRHAHDLLASKRRGYARTSGTGVNNQCLAGRDVGVAVGLNGANDKDTHHVSAGRNLKRPRIAKEAPHGYTRCFIWLAPSPGMMRRAS